MICKNCRTENPEEAVYCLHCGNRLDDKKICPVCQKENPEEAFFCLHCGKRLADGNGTGDPQAEQSEAPAKKSAFEKVKFAFDLSGGICLMVAVLFSLVFTLCMGITATAALNGSSSGLNNSLSETTMLWDYFGSAYKELSESLNSMQSYTGYFEAAMYLPVVLSTVVCAGTLVCVLVFTVISAVKYGKHFKNPELNYMKPAVAAVLSFILGAAAFLAINSGTAAVHAFNTISINNSTNSSTNIETSITYSGATTAGIVLGGVFLGLYFAFKTVTIGKDFVKKQTIADFVCTIVGVLFAVLAAAFAQAPAITFDARSGATSLSYESSFLNANLIISSAFSPDGTGVMPENFDATYICSVLAQCAQIAVLVLAFVVLVKRIGGFNAEKKSRLGPSVALFSVAAVYLILTCLVIYFGTELLSASGSGAPELSIAAAPIVAFIASTFAITDSITHKALLSKTKE